MMKLSTKGRYGVQAMLDLALHNSEGSVSLKSIAQRQELSENYLEQLFASLRRYGLIKSIRGAMGGYVLGDTPDKIIIGDVIRALEGPLLPVECLDEKKTKCAKYECCVTKGVWKKMGDGLNKVVDSISLQDLIDEYSKMKIKDNHMYYI